MFPKTLFIRLQASKECLCMSSHLLNSPLSVVAYIRVPESTKKKYVCSEMTSRRGQSLSSAAYDQESSQPLQAEDPPPSSSSPRERRPKPEKSFKLPGVHRLEVDFLAGLILAATLGGTGMMMTLAAKFVDHRWKGVAFATHIHQSTWCRQEHLSMEYGAVLCCILYHRTVGHHPRGNGVM
jgi:hypothetical protein